MKLLKLLFLSAILLSACNNDSTDTPETGEPKQIIVEMASNDFTDVSGTYTLENNKEYCTREDGKYKILLVKSTYINKEGKEKDILTYGILDVANKKYICYTANIVQSPNQKIPDRKTKCVIETHLNIKQNVILGANLKPV